MSLMVPDYDSMASARKSLGAVLDDAHRGHAVTIRRKNETAAVVAADKLRQYLATSLKARAEVFQEEGRWVVLLRGRPFVSEGLTVDEAIEDLILSARVCRGLGGQASCGAEPRGQLALCAAHHALK